jgi:hypothetical protein
VTACDVPCRTDDPTRTTFRGTRSEMTPPATTTTVLRTVRVAGTKPRVAGARSGQREDGERERDVLHGVADRRESSSPRGAGETGVPKAARGVPAGASTRTRSLVGGTAPTVRTAPLDGDRSQRPVSVKGARVPIACRFVHTGRTVDRSVDAGEASLAPGSGPNVPTSSRSVHGDRRRCGSDGRCRFGDAHEGASGPRAGSPTSTFRSIRSPFRLRHPRADPGCTERSRDGRRSRASWSAP